MVDTARENLPTQEEVQWAKNIRLALKGEDIPSEVRLEADKMSDFFLLQLAIVSKGKVPKAIKRMTKYVSFKTQFRLDKFSYEEANQWAATTFPGVVEGTGRRDVHSRVASCLDYSKFYPSKIRSEDDWSLLCKFFLGNMEASVTSLADARNGAVYLAQCNGISWSNFSMDMEHKLSKLYQESYPIKLKSIAMTNGGWLVNAFIGMCKWFLSKKIADRLVTCEESDLVGSESNTLRYFENLDPLPPMFGGTFKESYSSWFSDQMHKRNGAIDAVTLE